MKSIDYQKWPQVKVDPLIIRSALQVNHTMRIAFVFISLLSMIQTGGEVPTTTKQLQEITDIGVSSIQKALQELTAMHYIIRVRRGLILVDPRVAWYGHHSWRENAQTRFNEAWDQHHEACEARYATS